MLLSILIPIIIFSSFYVVSSRLRTRISPSIPYAGGGSLSARFKVLADYGKDPVKLLVEQRKILGDVFCVDLILFKLVFLLGADGNKAVFRAPEESLSFWENVHMFIGPFAGPSGTFPRSIKLRSSSLRLS